LSCRIKQYFGAWLQKEAVNHHGLFLVLGHNCVCQNGRLSRQCGCPYNFWTQLLAMPEFAREAGTGAVSVAAAYGVFREKLARILDSVDPMFCNGLVFQHPRWWMREVHWAVAARG
jgi:hypothetical protein